MIDQFGNGHKDQYKNQYKKETSQIHAPAALLERTRLAVAEEETRLQAENAQNEQSRAGWTGQTGQRDPAAEIEDRITDRITDKMPDTDAGIQGLERQKDRHRNYGRVYRWAFSAAAAIILLFAVHRSAMFWRTGAGKASMESASDTAAAGGYETDGSMSGSADEASGGEKGEVGNGAAADIAGEFGGTEYAEAESEDYAKLQSVPSETENSASLQSTPSRTENSASVTEEQAEGFSGGSSGAAESGSLSRDVSEDMVNANADMDSADGYDDVSGISSADQIEELDKKYNEEESASQISVTEVNRKPDFYNKPDAKRVVSQGITFYVAEIAAADDIAGTAKAEKGEWSAYAEYNGKKYVITGQADDREEFLEKACGFLKKL